MHWMMKVLQLTQISRHIQAVEASSIGKSPESFCVFFFFSPSIKCALIVRKTLILYCFHRYTLLSYCVFSPEMLPFIAVRITTPFTTLLSHRRLGLDLALSRKFQIPGHGRYCSKDVQIRFSNERTCSPTIRMNYLDTYQCL